MNTQLADRSFGDCEIPAISFLNGSAYFNIFDPYETAFITLVFHSVGTLLFATNHTQNVIETVRLFDDLDALRSDPDAFGFFKKMEPSHLSSGPPRKFAYITPITGGETLISFTDVTIEE
ncbi:MAG: hypothetical protein WBD90_11880 [Xanthobacteraceae bacterium]